MEKIPLSTLRSSEEWEMPPLLPGVPGSRGPRGLPSPQAVPGLEARARWQVPCDAELQLGMEQHGLQGHLPAGLGL